ncbi:uncharacterized protein LOC130338806 [Hyla sarda]|uniref:uncharacterized protein LOC130338806 n=1 Tax=Hyla sarda TaxID=327740 RepID=UPI0024C3D1F8|nr:uncharacterized protein LOC130338806 [Hyla sarda]
MADLEAAIRRVREELRRRGTGWLDQQLHGDAAGTSAAIAAPPRTCGRRSRAPSRVSPDAIPRSRRRQESPARDPPVRPAAAPTSECGESAGRNLVLGRGVVVPARAEQGRSARRRSRRGEAELLTAGPSAEAPCTGRARRSEVDGRVSPAARRGAELEAEGVWRACGRTSGHTAAPEGTRRRQDPSPRRRLASGREARGERVASSAPGATCTSEEVSGDERDGGGASPVSAAEDVAGDESDDLRPAVASVVVPPAAARGGGATGQELTGVRSGGGATRRGQGGVATAGLSAPERLGGQPCLVWIVGHSYVRRGASRADVRPAGRQLGLDREQAQVRWIGQGGLQWAGLLPLLQTHAALDRPPNVLVVHLGGNDLGGRTARALMRDIKLDMLRIWSSFPGIVVVWSDIVARFKWREARSVIRLNKARAKVNRVVSRFMARNGGLVVRHRELESPSWDFMDADGVHLNPLGMDLWVLEIREVVVRAVGLWVAGRE